MIVVFGSMNIDMVMPVDRFPHTGETVLCDTDYLSRSGGKGANQAVAAARCHAKVAIVGKVGDDAFGRRCVNNLKSQSIWTSGIGHSTHPTGCATIIVDKDGSNMVIIAPGANLEAASDQVPDDILTKKNILLTQMEVAPEEVQDVLARGHALGTTTILNAAPVAHVTPEILKTVDYLLLNHIEAQQLATKFGITHTDIKELAFKLAAYTQDCCIITMEDKGSYGVKGGLLYHQEALPVEVVDTTGAGDAFCGIFAACLHEGRSWADAVQYASIGASLSCLGLSAQAGMPFLEDIEARLGDISPPREITS